MEGGLAMARPRAFEESEVLDRAADVFGRHGYDGSTMVELTDAMGLNAPSIYAAFGSKRGLFDAVLKRCSAREDERWEWALAAPTAEGVVKRLLTTSPEQTLEGRAPCASSSMRAWRLALRTPTSLLPCCIAANRRN
jgi:AcrR family transcriptional regulator